MKYIKRFNESLDSTLLEKLTDLLEDKIDYDYDRDYDDTYCYMRHGDDGTWTKLIDSVYNLIRPELKKSYGSDISREDLENTISDIIPSSFTIGHQDEEFIESIFDDDPSDYDWDLQDEDDRSQANIDIKYENIAKAILNKFGL